MSLPEATLICFICGSYEHTLFPVLEGKYRGENVCSSCKGIIWDNSNKEIKRTRWNEKLHDYIEIPNQY